MATAAMTSLAPPEDRMDVGTPNSMNDIDIDYDLGDAPSSIKEDEDLEDADVATHGQPQDIDADMDGDTLHADEDQMYEPQDEEMSEEDLQKHEDQQIPKATGPNNTATMPTIMHAIELTYDGYTLPLFANDPYNLNHGWTDDLNFYDLSLNTLLAKIRQRLGELPTCPAHLPVSDVCLKFPQFDAELTENDAQAYQTSMSDLVSVYLALQRNDGVEDIPPFVVIMELYPSFAEQVAVFRRRAAAGLGLSYCTQRGDEALGQFSGVHEEEPVEQHAVNTSVDAGEDVSEQIQEYYDEGEGQEDEEYDEQDQEQLGDEVPTFEPVPANGTGGDKTTLLQNEEEQAEPAEYQQSGLQYPVEESSDHDDLGESTEEQQQSDGNPQSPANIPDAAAVMEAQNNSMLPDATDATAIGEFEEQNPALELTRENEELGEPLGGDEDAVDYDESDNEVFEGEFATEEIGRTEGVMVSQEPEGLGEHDTDGAEGETQEQGFAPSTVDDELDEQAELATQDGVLREGRGVDDTGEGDKEEDVSGNRTDAEKIDDYDAGNELDFGEDVEEGDDGPKVLDRKQTTEATEDGSVLPSGSKEAGALALTADDPSPSDSARPSAPTIPDPETTDDANPADTTQVDFSLGQQGLATFAEERDEYEDDEYGAEEQREEPAGDLLEDEIDDGLPAEDDADDADAQVDGEIAADQAGQENAQLEPNEEVIQAQSQTEHEPESSSHTVSRSSPAPAPAPAPVAPATIQKDIDDDTIDWDDLTPAQFEAQEEAKSPTIPVKRSFDDLDDDLFSEDDGPDFKKSKAENT